MVTGTTAGAAFGIADTAPTVAGGGAVGGLTSGRGAGAASSVCPLLFGVAVVGTGEGLGGEPERMLVYSTWTCQALARDVSFSPPCFSPPCCTHLWHTSWAPFAQREHAFRLLDPYQHTPTWCKVTPICCRHSCTAGRGGSRATADLSSGRCSADSTASACRRRDSTSPRRV